MLFVFLNVTVFWLQIVLYNIVLQFAEPNNIMTKARVYCELQEDNSNV